MIYKGDLELKDISVYRNRAMDRKREACKLAGIKFTGVCQIEFEILECIERLYQFNSDLPYVWVEEMDHPCKPGDYIAPKKHFHFFSEIRPDGSHIIYVCWEDVIKIYSYANLIFGKPWSELKISRELKDGVEYHPFEKSIYGYKIFEKFAGCQSALESYITKLGVWFLGLHEYAHVVNGHLSYKQDMRNRGIDIDIDIQRALEIHADMTAASYVLTILNSWSKYVGKTQRIVKTKGKNLRITYCDEIMFAVMAAYLSLRCYLKSDNWDEFTVGLHEGSNDIHPLTELRMAIVYNVFLQGVVDIGKTPEEKSIFARMLHSSIKTFEGFYFENRGSGQKSEEIYFRPTDLLRTEKGKKYYKEMFDAVLRLNDILVPYKNVDTRIEGTWTDYDTLPERIYWM